MEDVEEVAENEAKAEAAESEAESESQVYMACIMQNRRLGISYYDANDHRLYVLETWEDECGDFPVIDLVKYQTRPLVIYTSTKADESFIFALKKCGTKELQGPEVKIIKSSIFSYEHARHRLMYLQVAGMDADLNDKERLCFKFSCPSSLSTSDDWTTLSKSISSILHVRKIFEVGISERQHEQAGMLNLNIVRKAFVSITNELVYIYELINGVIKFNRSDEKRYRMMIAPGICQELDELRDIHESLPDFLEKVSSIELKRLSSDSNAIQGSIVYIPQIGYLMRFSGSKLSDQFLEKLQDFEFIFAGGEDHQNEFFYSTTKTKELDVLLGDVFHKILDMERAIIRDLELRIQPFSMHLNMASNFVGELDCMLSLALVARQYKYVRPVLTEEDTLQIKNGRHVLQEMIVETYIPNNTIITNEGRISIITGPNYSGKSIYIKQVALIVFLAHIGSFVPADSAIVGITDRIFFGVVNKHTVTSEKSTFMMDLHQIGIMLRHGTSRSLCLIDEFGKGTLTADGIGLLCATLKHFAANKYPPKVLVCTHLTEVCNETHLPKTGSFTFYTMSILKPDNNIKQGTDDIIFLYRLVPGCALSSYGLHCAQLAGVPGEILERAAYILNVTKDNKLIHRSSDERLYAKDKQYKEIAERLLAFDFMAGDVKAFFNSVFSPNPKS